MTGWKLWILVAAFAASIVFTGVFAFRTVHHKRHFRTDEQIRPWMSLPYIAHSYHQPPRVLYDSLGIPHPPRDRRPVREIARELKRPVNSVIADLMNAIESAREAAPVPPAGSPHGPHPGPAPTRSPLK